MHKLRAMIAKIVSTRQQWDRRSRSVFGFAYFATILQKFRLANRPYSRNPATLFVT